MCQFCETLKSQQEMQEYLITRPGRSGLAFSRYLGEDTCASIERALYNHELPPIPWAKVKKMLLDIRLPIQDVLVAGWMS